MVENKTINNQQKYSDLLFTVENKLNNNNNNVNKTDEQLTKQDSTPVDKVIEICYDFICVNPHNKSYAYYPHDKDNMYLNSQRILIGIIKNPIKIDDINKLVEPIYKMTIDVVIGQNNIVDSLDFEARSIKELEEAIGKENLWQNHNRYSLSVRVGFLNYLFSYANSLVEYKKQNLTGGVTTLNTLPKEYPAHDEFIKGFNSFKKIFSCLPEKNKIIVLSLIVLNFSYFIKKYGRGTIIEIIKHIIVHGVKNSFKTGTGVLTESLFKVQDTDNLSSSISFNTATSIARQCRNYAGVVVVDEVESILKKDRFEILYNLIKNLYNLKVYLTNVNTTNTNESYELLGGLYITCNQKPLSLVNKDEIKRRTLIVELTEEFDLRKHIDVTKDMLDSHQILGDAIKHSLYHDGKLIFDKLDNTSTVNDFLNCIWDSLEEQYNVDCTVFRNVVVPTSNIEDMEETIDYVRQCIFKKYNMQWEDLIDKILEFGFDNLYVPKLPFLYIKRDSEFGAIKTIIHRKDFLQWYREITDNVGISDKNIINLCRLFRFQNKQHQIDSNRIRGYELSEEELKSLFSIGNNEQKLLDVEVEPLNLPLKD